LAGAGDPFQFSTEGEIDQLDVVNRNVGAGVSPFDPFGKLPARNRLRLKQRAVAIINVEESLI
jgi:hypothetical protein